MKYAFVLKNEQEIPIHRLCQLLATSASVFAAGVIALTNTNIRGDRKTTNDTAVELAFYQLTQRYGSLKLSVGLCAPRFHFNEKANSFCTRG